jgi:natural product precursor
MKKLEKIELTKKADSLLSEMEMLHVYGGSGVPGVNIGCTYTYCTQNDDTNTECVYSYCTCTPPTPTGTPGTPSGTT